MLLFFFRIGEAVGHEEELLPDGPRWGLQGGTALQVAEQGLGGQGIVQHYR